MSSNSKRARTYSQYANEYGDENYGDHISELERLRQQLIERDRELKEREERESQLQKEREERESQLQKEREERESQLQKEREERESQLQKEREERESQLQKEREERMALQLRLDQRIAQMTIVDAKNKNVNCAFKFQETLQWVHRMNMMSTVQPNRTLGPEYFNFQIQGRQPHFRQIANILVQNFHSRNSSDHKKHRFVIVPGGSGIGKTRFAREIPNMMSPQRLSHQPSYAALHKTDQKALCRACCPSRILYVYLDLKRGYPADHFLDLSSPTLRMGVRLLARYLQKSHRDIAHLGVDLFCALTTRAVIEYMVQQHRVQHRIRRAIPVVVVIHIDEFQLYEADLQATSVYREFGMQSARQHFKEMMDEIGQVMVNRNTDVCGDYMILPVVTGTAAFELTYLPSHYQPCMIVLPPLSEQGALRMADERYRGHEQWPMWRKSREFRIALSETGYIPHFVELLLARPIPRIGWSDSMMQALTSRREQFDHPSTYYRMYDLNAFLGWQVARSVLLVSLARLPVPRNLLIGTNGQSHTVQEVESYGTLFTRACVNTDLCFQREEDCEMCQPWVTLQIPFLMLRRINELLNESVMDPAFMVSCTEQRPWTWQDLERFHSHYMKLRIEAMLHWAERRVFTYDARVAKYDKELAQLDAALAKHSDNIMPVIREKIHCQNERDGAARCASRVRECVSQGWTLSDLFPGALGQPVDKSKALHVRYDWTLRTCYTEAVQCLRSQHDQLQIDPHAPIACVDVDGRTRVNRSLWEGIFRCCANTFLIDERMALRNHDPAGRPLLVLVQTKHTGRSTNVYTRECRSWYKQVDRATQLCRTAFDIVYVWLTNRKLGESRNLTLSALLDKCPRLVLLTRSQLPVYLGQAFCLRGMLATDMESEFRAEDYEDTIGYDNDDEEEDGQDDADGEGGEYGEDDDDDDDDEEEDGDDDITGSSTS